MELTADLLKSLNNIRQNATIYVHAYHYTDDEKMRYGTTLIPALTEVNRAAVRKNYQSASEWFRLYQA